MLNNEELGLIGSIISKLPLDMLKQVLDNLDDDTKLELLEHWIPSEEPVQEPEGTVESVPESVPEPVSEPEPEEETEAEKVVKRKQRIDLKEPANKFDIDVTKVQLGTVGKVRMDAYKKGLDAVAKYHLGILKAKRLVCNKNFRLLIPHNSYRLLSKDNGESWEIMTASTYSKKLRQFSTSS